MRFRFGQDSKQELARDEIFVAEFSDQRGVSFDLSTLEQQIFYDHLGQRSALLRMDADRGGFSREFFEIEDRNAAQLLDASRKPVCMSQLLFRMSFELGFQPGFNELTTYCGCARYCLVMGP